MTWSRVKVFGLGFGVFFGWGCRVWALGLLVYQFRVWVPVKIGVGLGFPTQ